MLANEIDMIALSLDKDGVFANDVTILMRYLVQKKIRRKLQLDQQTELEETESLEGEHFNPIDLMITIEMNKILLNNLREYCKQNAKHLILLHGSANLDHDLDHYNRRRGDYIITASCFHIVYWVAEWFKKELDPKVSTELDMYTLTDTLNDKEHGHVFRQMLEHLKTPLEVE